MKSQITSLLYTVFAWERMMLITFFLSSLQHVWPQVNYSYLLCNMYDLKWRNGCGFDFTVCVLASPVRLKKRHPLITHHIWSRTMLQDSICQLGLHSLCISDFRLGTGGLPHCWECAAHYHGWWTKITAGLPQCLEQCCEIHRNRRGRCS